MINVFAHVKEITYIIINKLSTLCVSLLCWGTLGGLRYLTPFGKITILKTLILSQFNHLFTSVVIEKKILVDINKIFYEFLWNGKPDKISRNDVCRSYHAGGLK